MIESRWSSVLRNVGSLAATTNSTALQRVQSGVPTAFDVTLLTGTIQESVGPSARTFETPSKVERKSESHEDSRWPTNLTHHDAASLRLLATPALTNVSSTSRSVMRSRVMTGIAKLV